MSHSVLLPYYKGNKVDDMTLYTDCLSAHSGGVSVLDWKNPFLDYTACVALLSLDGLLFSRLNRIFDTTQYCHYWVITVYVTLN